MKGYAGCLVSILSILYFLWKVSFSLSSMLGDTKIAVGYGTWTQDRFSVISNDKQGFSLKLLKLKIYCSYNEVCSNVILLRNDCFFRKFSLWYLYCWLMLTVISKYYLHTIVILTSLSRKTLKTSPEAWKHDSTNVETGSWNT